MINYVYKEFIHHTKEGGKMTSQGNKQLIETDSQTRYNELKELLADYGLLCRLIYLREKEKLVIETDDPNEDYRMIYDDSRQGDITQLACTIIDNYVNTFNFL